MVREAQRAGLNFDDDKLRALNCVHDEPARTRDPTPIPVPETHHSTISQIPTIEIDPASPAPDARGAPLLSEPLEGVAEELDDMRHMNGEKQINGEHSGGQEQFEQHHDEHH